MVPKGLLTRSLRKRFGAAAVEERFWQGAAFWEEVERRIVGFSLPARWGEYVEAIRSSRDVSAIYPTKDCQSLKVFGKRCKTEEARPL